VVLILISNMEIQRNIQTINQLAFSIPINSFDIILILVFFVYVFEEIALGLISSLINLFSMIGALTLGLLLYPKASSLLFKFFFLSKGFSDAVAFLMLSVIFYFLISSMLSFLIKRSEIKLLHVYSKIGGIISGSFSFFLISAFVVSLLLSFPVSGFIKSEIRSSFSGKFLFTYTQNLENISRTVFSGAISETLNFMTIKPDGGSSISLHFKTNKFNVDKESEEKMLVLVNNERKKRGLLTLTVDSNLKGPARAHGKDMLERGYFSHYTPEGYSPFDRLEKYEVNYETAAENLAYAPDVELAFTGLMNSEGHKKNILDPNFNKVGIGVIDAGVYGKMFVQEFTD
jgi:uncharacterized protein YkwD